MSGETRGLYNINMKKILLALLMPLAILISTNSEAGSFGKYGVGILSTAEYGPEAAKFISMGYVGDWFGPFIHQYEVGIFADSSGHGRRSSGLGFYSVGVEVNPGYLLLRSMWGVGAITSPDSMLGGWFQLTQDLTLGFKDNKGKAIGLNYKHISSAGIYDPNKGRDFITVVVEIPW